MDEPIEAVPASASEPGRSEGPVAVPMPQDQRAHTSSSGEAAARRADSASAGCLPEQPGSKRKEASEAEDAQQEGVWSPTPHQGPSLHSH